eukprot:gene34084-44039_t
MAKRTRPDILTTVAFLATRVSKSTDEDWSKLERLLKYINHSRDLCLTLQAGEKLCVEAYIDASFAVHADAKSHSGVSITLGGGTIFAQSVKQKLVSKSSTEAELIALSDGISQVIWTREFIISQGINIPAAIVYQDNLSTMAMVSNGRSTSARTRHVNIKYFFVKDRVESGEIDIKHLSTDKMVADILTKPLLGELFTRMRKWLLNIIEE